MAQGWADGYMAEISYSNNVLRETTPAWIALAAVLLGHRPPRLDRPFRWCDLGCGQGLTALAVAASHPEAEVYGFDFNPSHIDNARTLAGAASLSNAHFVESSFEELAAAPDGAWPQMDFIVLHGIWSWVSPAQRAHLLRFIGRHLAPGGLLYVSYNTLSGWAAMQPAQRLMRLLADLQPGPPVESMQRGVALLGELARAKAGYFETNPAVGARLEVMASQDPRYLAHEYLNAHWEPQSFEAVARDMEAAKCGFIGSATLLDNVDAVSVPPDMLGLIGKTANIHLREVLRDLGAARPFRRDLYRRGLDQPPAGDRRDLLDAVVLTGLERVRTDTEMTVETGIGTVTGERQVYAPLLERLRAGPLAGAELRTLGALAGAPLSEALQAVAFLAAGAFAHPTPNPDAPQALLARAAALNHAIGRHNRQGGAITFLAAPTLGTALLTQPMQTMIFDECAPALEPNVGPAVGRIIAALAGTGRMPLRDGKPVTDPQAAQEMVIQAFQDFAQRVPTLRAAGILPPAATP